MPRHSLEVSERTMEVQTVLNQELAVEVPELAVVETIKEVPKVEVVTVPIEVPKAAVRRHVGSRIAWDSCGS